MPTNDPDSSAPAPWGRVDETGTVFVRDGESERAVGQYPDGSPEEALAYFERKYTDLEGQVRLLEARSRRGAPAQDIAKAVSTLLPKIATANAVGDLESLRTRLSALSGEVSVLTEQQSAASKAAVDEALAQREALVVAAEALASEDPAKTQWKVTTTKLDELFAQWQKHQQDGPRLPRNDANDLWKRFRAARSTIETNRKAFFSQLDGEHRDAKQRKEGLVEKAEALAGRGVDGIPQYRALLDEWKLSGRAGKRFDDALWDRFKAAGDVLYGAKAEVDARDNEEFSANLELKLAVLTDAETILTIKDHQQAEDRLLVIQRKWDAIGKVPRDQVKVVEDRLRKVENHVKALNDEHWSKNNPETKARAEGLAGQLTAAIAKLETELEAAKASKDAAAIAKAEEALAARRVWLDALG